MTISKLWVSSLALLATVSLPLQAASPVTVGSKIDTEGALLGNMILQVLESHGVKTVNKIQLGTTPVVRGAITAGELDIYPEYTGNGAFFFKDENDPAWKNAKQGFEKVKKLDAEQNKLVWLTPAPANNTWTIAIRQDIAEKNKLSSLADLSRYLKEGGTFKQQRQRDNDNLRVQQPAPQRPNGNTADRIATGQQHQTEAQPQSTSQTGTRQRTALLRQLGRRPADSPQHDNKKRLRHHQRQYATAFTGHKAQRKQRASRASQHPDGRRPDLP